MSIGLVVGLDYKNSWVESYHEFQTCYSFRKLRTASHRAHTLSEAGLQSLPQVHFSGCMLIGSPTGMVNTPNRKGTHSAMRTGTPGADAAFAAPHPGAAFVSTPSPATFKPTGSSASPSSESESSTPLKPPTPLNPLNPPRLLRRLPQLATSGPCAPRLGLAGSVLYAGVDVMLRARTHASPDALAMRPTAVCALIAYPAFEPPLSTDLMSSVAFAGTNHAEDEAVHLRAMRGPALMLSAVNTVGAKAEEEETGRVDAQEMAARRRSHVAVNADVCGAAAARISGAGV
ncbi:hypothetical protein DFH09DRAFT_1316365 [Mycena vulgaris]|nr:hypothetical protein DFH09DRAFT_1316365 [Mycena vulgaris]